jgi:hypothetical protein
MDILEECTTRKDTNRKVNDKCSRTLSSNCSQMWLQWNLFGALHSGPCTGKAASRLGLKWHRWQGGHMTQLHMISYMVRLSTVETGCTSASWSVVCVHLVSGYVLLLVLAYIQLQPYILLRHDLCDSPIFLSTLSSSGPRISFPSSCHLTLFRSVEFIFNIICPTYFFLLQSLQFPNIIFNYTLIVYRHRLVWSYYTIHLCPVISFFSR